MRRLGTMLLATALWGCGVTLPEDGELELKVLALKGTEVGAAFINGSGTTVDIGHLECMTGVEVRIGGIWQEVDIWPGDQSCILPMYRIRPHRAYVYETLAPSDAGTYRLVVAARVEGDRPDLPGGGDHIFVVRSNEFEVRE